VLDVGTDVLLKTNHVQTSTMSISNGQCVVTSNDAPDVRGAGSGPQPDTVGATWIAVLVQDDAR
jgi:hypothetical protein